MPEEFEVETKDLQETIEELHEERKEREESERRTAWTRYIALTTAILAVFAAVAALRAGTLVNEAVLKQLKASDTWNEYQADRTKDHLYSIQAYELLDAGVKPPAAKEVDPAGSEQAARKSAGEANGSKDDGAAKPAGEAHPPAREGGEKHAGAAPKKRPGNNFKPLSRSHRLAMYLDQVRGEREKEADLMKEAKNLEKEGGEDWHLHEHFAIAVALIQVAIALGAVAALTRIKPVWALSLIVGVIGIYFFAHGLLPH